jgi:uncharacterized coiled-coil DUF342 family protein
MNPQEIQKINQLYKQLDQVTQENEQLKANATQAGWDQIAEDIDLVKQQIQQLITTTSDIHDNLNSGKSRKK